MFQLTKRGDYGVLAVCYIAQRSAGAFTAIDEIATHSHIPRPYLSKILQDLCRSGILKSRRGFGGGFILARSPEHITFSDILNSVEDRHALVACTGHTKQCERSIYCLAAPFWNDIQHILNDLIANITIADLVYPERRSVALRQLQQCRRAYESRELL